jgi:hypothetical protein
VKEQELQIIKENRGPSAALKTDAERYMRETEYRKAIDDADAAKGTQAGAKLRRIFFGQPEEAPTPQQPQQPTAVEVANWVKKFDKARCLDLFVGEKTRTGDARHSEIASKLSKEDYAEARTAARFWGIPLSGQESGASVTFAYETPRDRAAKKAAREAAATNAERKQSEILPPGVEKDAKGNIVLADVAKFDAWKSEQSTHKDAIKFLEEAGGTV